MCLLMLNTDFGVTFEVQEPREHTCPHAYRLLDKYVVYGLSLKGSYSGAPPHANTQTPHPSTPYL